MKRLNVLSPSIDLMRPVYELPGAGRRQIKKKKKKAQRCPVRDAEPHSRQFHGENAPGPRLLRGGNEYLLLSTTEL